MAAGVLTGVHKWFLETAVFPQLSQEYLKRNSFGEQICLGLQSIFPQELQTTVFS